MSINVTVNGNPVKIKRGTMVTADPDRAKQELDKRRKIRLAQVRQQSNEIAAKVRKNVQKERDNQLSEIEKRGAEKLERWKMRKLLQFQEQYCDSLKSLGLGHAQAAVEETRDKVVQTSKDALIEKTKLRCDQAVKKLHEKQRQNRKNKSFETKKTSKSTEGSRKSIKVIKSPFKKKKKRKKAASRNTSHTKSGSDLESTATDYEVPDLDYNTDLEVSDNEVRRKHVKTPTSSESPFSSIHTEGKQPSPEMKNKLVGPSAPESLASKITTPRSPRSESRSPSPPKLADIIIHHPPDTRISDRIKNRRLPPFKNPMLDDIYEGDKELIAQKDPPKLLISTGTLTDDGQVCSCCCKCSCRKQKNNMSSADKVGTSKNVGTITDSDLFSLKIQTVTCNCCTCKIKTESPTKLLEKGTGAKKRNVSPGARKCICRTEIPSKPTIVLKGAQKSKLSDVDKVQYYDHRNRFAKNYPLPENQVKQIPESDIEVLPTARSEKELLETMQRRDKEAQIRGKKASEKQKIEKDYKELMEKLPALQRQERIASINAKNLHNPEFHMGDSRLKQQELKKQCRMEDTYEKLFPNTITLKPKVHNVNEKPFRVIDTTDNSTPIPFHWDIDNVEKGGVTITKDDGIITINPNVSDQTDNLKNMLEKLKKQKEMLMKEVETLPRDSNLNSLIDDLENLQSAREKSPVAPPTSPTKNIGHSELVKNRAQSDYAQQRQKKKSPKILHAKSSIEDRNKHARKHNKIHKIVLQNTSTQTSPKVTLATSDQPKKMPTPRQREKQEMHKKKHRKQSPVKMTSASAPSFSVTKNTTCSKLTPGDKSGSQAIHDKSCKCKCPACKQSGVCEIVIKIQDDVPQINIKSPTKAKVATVGTSSTLGKVEHKGVPEPIVVRTVGTNDDRTSEDKIPVEPKKILPKMKSISTGDKTESKLTWSKTLSCSPNEPSTSTSYYSPPDFQKFCDVASTELSNAERKESLLKYIKKLLGMSRRSIENLAVSAGSEVSLESTMSASSDPVSAANLALKILDLNLKDIEKHINNTDTSTSTVPDGSEPIKSIDYDASVSNDNRKLTEDESTNTDVYDTRLASIAQRYQCMADQCQKRISGLTAMIEKVRKEKEQILSPTFSDKEASTAYLNLPSTLGQEGNKSPYENTSSESEKEQSILNRLLLDVNINYDKIKDRSITNGGQPENSTQSFIDPETYERYKNLLKVGNYSISKTEGPSQGTVVITEIRASNSANVPYVPMVDIPRLPKLQHSQFIIDETPKVKKPPTAKGLNAAKKFNGDITTTPHELSTIVEVDSQLSTKVPSPQKPSKQDNDNIVDIPVLKEPVNIPKILITEESMPDIVAEIKDSSNTSDSTPNRSDKQQTDRSGSSDMDNLEAMLVSMGMGWAVSTLRKTQEALLKAASSTSSDDGQKPKDVTNSSTSDVTLRDTSGKKLFNTSTTTSTSQSLSPFIKELEEISAIQGSGLSTDNGLHRTSTPVGLTVDNSTEKSKKADKKVRISEETDNSSKSTDEALGSIPPIEKFPREQKKS